MGGDGGDLLMCCSAVKGTKEAVLCEESPLRCHFVLSHLHSPMAKSKSVTGKKDKKSKGVKKDVTKKDKKDKKKKVSESSSSSSSEMPADDPEEVKECVSVAATFGLLLGLCRVRVFCSWDYLFSPRMQQWSAWRLIIAFSDSGVFLCNTACMFQVQGSQRPCT